MKARLLLAAFCVLSVPAFALYEVGDKVPNTCWKDSDEKTVCLDDSDIKSTVRVLLYNTGWCGPCNAEFRELSPRAGEFAGKPVTFLSLSAAGWKSGSQPTTAFLGEWKAKHKFPFRAAASPRNSGSDYFAKAYIPNVVILNRDGKVAYKAINPGVEAIFSEIIKAMR